MAYSPKKPRAAEPGEDPDAVYDGIRNSKAKSERMDLGLALLASVAEPGVCYSLDEIAAWCGCTHQAISRIEKRAIKKVCNRLLPIWRELQAQRRSL